MLSQWLSRDNHPHRTCHDHPPHIHHHHLLTPPAVSTADAVSEEELAPPIFTRQLTDCRAREGRALVLSATVTGNPLPVVTWLRDGACVDASPDYVITYNNGDCQLRIEEALPQDGGQFVCRASNMLGSDQTAAAVRVERESWAGWKRGGESRRGNESSAFVFGAKRCE